MPSSGLRRFLLCQWLFEASLFLFDSLGSEDLRLRVAVHLRVSDFWVGFLGQEKFGARKTSARHETALNYIDSMLWIRPHALLVFQFIVSVGSSINIEILCCRCGWWVGGPYVNCAAMQFEVLPPCKPSTQEPRTLRSTQDSVRD